MKAKNLERIKAGITPVGKITFKGKNKNRKFNLWKDEEAIKGIPQNLNMLLKTP